jgi:hypothetical protein
MPLSANIHDIQPKAAFVLFFSVAAA